jgi:Type II secretion system (T2SS), protein K
MPKVHLHFASRFPRHSRRGSVILFVLGVILLTAFLLTRLIDRAGTELLAESKATNRAVLRDQAYAGLEVTLAVLADVSAADGGLYAPQQGWDRPLQYAGYEPPAGFEVTVSFQDETGKLSLATVNEAVLQHYLETIGAAVSDAERLTDALLVWTKKDYLPGSSEADPRNYENSPLPYEPPQRALRTFAELRAVNVARELFFDTDGKWTELGNKFRNDTSLYEFTNVNVNSANSSVLMGLGVAANEADALVRETAVDPKNAHDPKFYRSVADAAGVLGTGAGQAGLGAEVQCLRVRVTVNQGARVFTLEAVVQPGSSSSQTANPNTAQESPDPNVPPPTPVDPRALTRKSIDYPFRILELRETDGPAQ